MAPKDRATRAKGVSERGGDQRGILIDVSSFWHRMATSVYGGKSRHRVRSKRPEDNAQQPLHSFLAPHSNDDTEDVVVWMQTSLLSLSSCTAALLYISLST